MLQNSPPCCVFTLYFFLSSLSAPHRIPQKAPFSLITSDSRFPSFQPASFFCIIYYLTVILLSNSSIHANPIHPRPSPKPLTWSPMSRLTPDVTVRFWISDFRFYVLRAQLLVFAVWKIRLFYWPVSLGLFQSLCSVLYRFYFPRLDLARITPVSYIALHIRLHTQHIPDIFCRS